MSRPAAASRGVAAWLFVCCALVFAMVVVGGVTRLTHSGLSIVEWQPIVGTLPPTSEAEPVSIGLTVQITSGTITGQIVDEDGQPLGHDDHRTGDGGVEASGPTRSGVVTKLSHKGLMMESWEGEMLMALPAGIASTAPTEK